MEMLRSTVRSLSSESSGIPPAPPATGSSSSSPPTTPNGGAKRERGRERDALDALINDRDHKIALLEHDVRQHRAELIAARRDLDEVRLRMLEHAHLQSVEVSRRKREARAASARVKIYKRDMEDKESLKGYAELIREAAPPSVDSSYVLKLQKQIQKAENRMESQREQMGVIKQKSDEVMESLTTEICEVVEEKSRVEIEMANQLKILRKEKGESEQKSQTELERVEKRLKHLTEKLKRLEGDEDEDEGEDEGDDSADNEGKKYEAVENGDSSLNTETETETGGESKADKLKHLQQELEALKLEGSQTEEELRSTLKSRRDEIARLKESSFN